MGSTLKSFSFGVYKGYSEIPASVWGLFTEMGNDPTKSVPYVDEILNAGLEGRIATNLPFYIDAYCKAVESNTRMADYARVKRVVSTVDTDVKDMDDMRNAYGTVSLSHVSLVARMEDSFDKLADDEELRYAISQIRSLNESFILEYSVNIIETIKYAVRGIPSAIDNLRKLCNEFSDIAEYVQIILSSGRGFEEIFA